MATVHRWMDSRYNKLPFTLPPGMLMLQSIIDPTRFDYADILVRDQPFCFLIATDQLPNERRPEFEQDFPRYAGAGFFPYEQKDCGPSINRLVTDLTSPNIANAIGKKLGVENLGTYPTLVTLCRSLNKRHGTIHTDSHSKVVTALLYFNQSWPETSAGCLRFLANKNEIDALITPEVKPLYGNFVAFKRADNSFHGHLPFEGERRVIQIAWLTSEEEKLRKTRRGRMSRFFKWLFGKWDRRFGADTPRNYLP